MTTETAEAQEAICLSTDDPIERELIQALIEAVPIAEDAPWWNDEFAESDKVARIPTHLSKDEIVVFNRLNDEESGLTKLARKAPLERRLALVEDLGAHVVVLYREEFNAAAAVVSEATAISLESGADPNGEKVTRLLNARRRLEQIDETFPEVDLGLKEVA